MQLLDRAIGYVRRAPETYANLPFVGKLFVWYWGALHVLFGWFFYQYGPQGMFELMASGAQELQAMELGWLILLGLTLVTAFPPLMGYSTCVTIAGFAFGPWKGWLLASAGCLIGSGLSFVVVRHALSVFAPLLSSQKTLKALGSAVEDKGMPLVILIRLCPFPYAYSNLFFASLNTVSLQQFLLATLAITPKLLIHVWVGSRMFLFADPDSLEKMDSQARIVNGIYVALGTALGFGTSWFLYRTTMQYVQEGSNVALDLEEGGELLRNVDEMLGEDVEENDSDERARAPPAAASGKASVRQSEDRWDGAFSDFDDPLELEERDAEGGVPMKATKSR